jgi:hypothetical protein
MLRIDKKPPTLYTPDKAEDVTEQLNADAELHEEDWKFEAVHDPKGTGYSRIKVVERDSSEVIGWL